MKTEFEIRELLNNIDTTIEKFPAMTYEQGVEAALSWVLGETDDTPMD